MPTAQDHPETNRHRQKLVHMKQTLLLTYLKLFPERKEDEKEEEVENWEEEEHGEEDEEKKNEEKKMICF